MRVATYTLLFIFLVFNLAVCRYTRIFKYSRNFLTETNGQQLKKRKNETCSVIYKFIFFKYPRFRYTIFFFFF